jgi:adenylate cyclase
VICVVFFASIVSVSLVLSSVVVAFEKSSRYLEAAGVTGVAVAVLAHVVILPGSRRFRLAQRWAAGHKAGRTTALADTYRWNRAAAA